MFTFSAHPAAITVTEGIQDAFHFLQTSWRLWLPVTATVAVCSFMVYAILYSLIGKFDGLYYVNSYNGQIVWTKDAGSVLGPLVGPLIIVGILFLAVTVISSWVFYATAISGLRNRPVTVSGVIARGLVSIVAEILIGVLFIGVLIAAFLVIAVVFVASPGLGALLILALIFGGIPAAFYLEIRLFLAPLAIFDGFGPIEGIRESWRLSRGAVLRMLGWGLLAGLIGMGFGIIGSVVSVPLSVARIPALGQAFSTAVTTTGSCLVIFIAAVIYESQRARNDPSLYGPPPAPAYAWPYPPTPYGPGPYPGGPNPWVSGPGPAGPAGAPGPYGPSGPTGSSPYAAGPYPGGQYGAWPYPAAPLDSTAMPGWVNPNVPQGRPSYQNVPPQWGPNAPGPYPAAQMQPGPNLPYQNAAPGFAGNQSPPWQPPTSGWNPSFGPGPAAAADEPAAQSDKPGGSAATDSTENPPSS